MTYELPLDPPADERTGPSAQPRSRRPSRRLLFVYSCAIAALTIAVDVISKQLALHFLDTENRIPVLGDLFGLQLAFNTGAAFSIGAQLTPFITLLGLVASVLLIRLPPATCQGRVPPTAPAATTSPRAPDRGPRG